jgi:CheY-like chemotaxis protein
MKTARPPTILCIDDEPAALKLRTLLLEQAGYKVIPAANAHTALQLFESQIIDLVISDHLQPDMAGAELTRQMKLERPFVPVMLFSGVTDVPDGASHADLFLSKAEGPVALLGKVADLLRCSRISEGNYFAEIRCDHRVLPSIWHYTIQRLRSVAIVGWSQSFSEEGAVEAARQEMRDLNEHDKPKKKH